MGAWCFADHMGPELVTETQGLDIGPHPHTGLQTVTWLVAGEVLHGVQLWMAQPEATRHGPAAFEHHAQLPRVELDNAVATVLVDDQVVRPGQLAYLGVGRGELVLSAADPTRVLLGGEPFAEPVLMWWYLVVRSRGELDRAYRQWESGDPRFGRLRSPLARILTSATVWARPTQPG